MLVTHRGPYRFSVRDDGSFASRRGAGGLVSALLPLVQRDDIGERPSWVAAAIDDGDRAAVAAGAATVPGLGVWFRGPQWAGRLALGAAVMLPFIFLVGLGFLIGNLAFVSPWLVRWARSRRAERHPGRPAFSPAVPQ